MKTWLTALVVAIILVPNSGKTLPIASFEQISPNPTNYNLISDFYPFKYTAVGDVTSQLQSISGLGGTLSDFHDFTAGNIALIERGSYPFQIKVQNTFLSGGIGAIIYDNIPRDEAVFGTLISQAEIPAIFVTRDIGLELFGLINSGPTNVHIVTNTAFPPSTIIPEPSTFLLLGGGLAGLAFVTRRRKKE